MGGRDDDHDDDTIGTLDHDALVAYLNRLYASAGERMLSSSAAKASTDDELREAIETVRRRLAQPKAGSGPLPPMPPRAASVLDRRATSGQRKPMTDGAARVLCVLVTANAATATRARGVMRSRGLPLVVVDSLETLVRVFASTTPTHVVIDAALGSEIDVNPLLGPRAADVRVYWSNGEEATLAALASVT